MTENVTSYWNQFVPRFRSVTIVFTRTEAGINDYCPSLMMHGYLVIISRMRVNYSVINDRASGSKGC